MNSLDLWYQPELLSVLALAATSLCPKPRNADCLQVPPMPTNGHHQIPSKSLQVLGDRRPSHKSKLLSGAQSDRLGKSVYKTDCTKLCSCENVLDWFSCEQTTKQKHLNHGGQMPTEFSGFVPKWVNKSCLFRVCRGWKPTQSSNVRHVEAKHDTICVHVSLMMMMMMMMMLCLFQI